MALNCKVVESKKDTPVVDYPCLMEYNSEGHKLIVLATGKTTGIRVSSDEEIDYIGTIEDCWYAFDDNTWWKPYNGSVTLSNK